MKLTLYNFEKRKSRSYYRQGDNEEKMRTDLFAVSGITKIISENNNFIEKDLKEVPLGRSKIYREIWGLRLAA